MSEQERIVVTGAGGFIGSHLTEQLVRLGKPVRAFIHYNSAGRRGWLEESAVASEVEFVSGSVRDFDCVYRAVQGCAVVIHLAALVGIPFSYVSPHAYVRTNVDGALNILEAARANGVRKVILTSSSEVYGNAKCVPMDEQHAVDCRSPYAATKAAADQLALSYFRSFDLPVTIIRPFNTYGPRQSSRAIIPSIISQILSLEGVIHVGNVEPRRDFTFVDDTVRGFLAAFNPGLLTGEIVHVGGGVGVSIGDVIQTVARLTGRDPRIKRAEVRVRPPASEVDRLICDSRKLQSATGWCPQVSLEEGLRRTIQWIEPRLNSFRPSEYAV